MNGGSFGLIDIGNDQLGERAPERFGFAIAKQPLRASIPGLDDQVGSGANDGVAGGGNNCGKLGVASLRPKLPHGAMDCTP
jgi:hypothetical protein